MPSITETSPLLEGQRTAEHPAADAGAVPAAHAHGQSESKTLIYACCITLFFFFVELIGGYVAQSLAIMSDAAHLLSDVAGLGISLIAVWVSCLPANSRMSFGFARAEVLGAFVSVFFIWALTAVLVVFAIYRLFHPTPVDGHLMLLLGCIGLGVNIVLGFVLGHSHAHAHGHGHGHGHGHSHGHAHGHSHSHPSHSPSQLHSPSHTRTHTLTDSPSHFDSEPPGDIEHGSNVHYHDGHDDQHNHPASHDQDDDGGGGGGGGSDMTNSHHEQRNPRERSKFSLRNFLFGTDIQSVNVRAAYLHVLGDALQSVGVIIAAIVICIDNRLSFVDPICTLLFAALVIMTTAGLARDTIAVLMEATPPSIKLDEIYHRLLQIEGVRRVGDLHVWSISASQPALSVHLYQKAHAAAHDVLKETRQILASEFRISHATVQINCEETECCDEKVYLGTTGQLKNCVNYQSLMAAGTPPVTAIQISSNVPADGFEPETVTRD